MYIIYIYDSFKSQINTEFGGELRLVNDPLNPMQQIIFIDCPDDQYSYLERKIDEKISEINKKISSNVINTITSNPDQLKVIFLIKICIEIYLSLELNWEKWYQATS